jgi:hypothetical protein
MENFPGKENTKWKPSYLHLINRSYLTRKQTQNKNLTRNCLLKYLLFFGHVILPHTMCPYMYPKMTLLSQMGKTEVRPSIEYLVDYSTEHH